MSNPIQNLIEPNTIEIFLNGERRDVPNVHTLATLLDWLDLRPDRVAIELNKNIVRKRDWNGTPVTDGSRLEIVEFVGGG